MGGHKGRDLYQEVLIVFDHVHRLENRHHGVQAIAGHRVDLGGQDHGRDTREDSFSREPDWSVRVRLPVREVEGQRSRRTWKWEVNRSTRPSPQCVLPSKEWTQWQYQKWLISEAQ